MFDFLVYVPEDSRARVGRYFWLREFRCKGCGMVRINPGFMELVARLDAMRAEAGRACTINSGHRCEEHNATVPGAAKDSRHKYGDGADWRFQGQPISEDRRLARKYFPTSDGCNVIEYSTHTHTELRGR